MRAAAYRLQSTSTSRRGRCLHPCEINILLMDVKVDYVYNCKMFDIEALVRRFLHAMWDEFPHATVQRNRWSCARR
jgi:hypothetical protein